jgi:hypothetical protein
MSLKKDIKKILNIKVILGLLIFLIISFMWFKYIAGLVIVAVFAPITFLSVRYSKMVPHISIETNTGMSAFMGYVFGPIIGSIYAIIVGLTCYVGNSFISATYLAIPMLGAFCAVLMGLLSGIGIKFATAFAITIITRTVVAYYLYAILGADPIERLTHQASQMLTNLILYLPLLNSIYGLVIPFVGG